MTDLTLAGAMPVLLGPFIGSFLGVLAERLPRGEDVVRRPSACRCCGARLGPADLVPILSFALRRGRCRHCAAPIPPWLLYTEILATGAACLAVLAGGTPAGIWYAALFLWLLIVLGMCDLMFFRLPDILTGALLVLTLVGAAIWEPGGLGPALIAAAAGAGSFLALRIGYRLLRRREGLGLGDVKLMAGLGAFAGLRDLPLLVLLAALAALGAALAGRLGRGRLPRGDLALPFGASLCAAAAGLWLLRAADAI
ncbi:prepilin peptidase [Salipiger abyssi]|uniref:Prepilin leader peptidase/N-methyltransferase n=1 Tax=Salipiger abyssi TaxID=1250539 RepID=A0A1P8UXD8_9RHOB|nr:A24 family peptidase [Salipiger abyssi]APZ54045.1 leader peptidase (prepilin peptidase) / N-methyltransferase [Salipiger abyssi]